LNQTYRDFELVIVDDGSSDDSAVEVLRHLGPDPERAESLWRQHAASATGTLGFGFWVGEIPLQYIHQPNRGIGPARNRGFQTAQGELIAFLEPDFQWDPGHLETHLNYFDEHPDVWIAHGRVLSSRSSSRKGRGKERTPRPITFEQVVAGDQIYASAIVCRRDCLEAHCGFDENLPACDDYDLWVRIAAHVPIYQIPGSIVCMKKSTAAPAWSLDRYRVYALEKAYQSGHLNSEQRHRVADELVARCDVLVEGFRKRKNHERANFYDRKRKKFEIEVAKLDLSDAATNDESVAGEPEEIDTAEPTLPV
jgi:glycosyltransferase involved in cell wall biosynthesis